MLGLAIIGGEGPEPEVCRLAARGAGIVAAADSGLVAAEEAGISADWIIGDMDSLDTGKRLEKYPADRICRFPEDKDFTDTELALDLLWEKGCSEIWLLGGGGGRLDHLLAIYSIFERNKFPKRWITATDDIYCLDVSDSAADSAKLEKCLPINSMVSVLPVGAGPWAAESCGLKWPLDGLIWNRGSTGISNRTIRNSFSIKAIRGRYIVILPLKTGEE